MEYTFSEKLAKARVFLEEMLVERGATVVRHEGESHSNRFEFRVVAVRKDDSASPSVYVALFCDVIGRFCTADGTYNACKPSTPSLNAVEIAVANANKETASLFERRRLVVLLLRANATPQKSMDKNVREFVRKLNQLSDVIRVEAWHLNELLYNPLRHSLVPRHVRADKNSRAQLQRKYGRDYAKRLPKLLTSDPVARWLEFLPGDVVCAHEVDSRRGDMPYYMQVVACTD